MKKYINKITQGSNLDVMSDIADETVDLIFADPPYNMQLDKTLKRFNGSDFDGVNDEWDKFDSLESYDDFSRKWLEQSLRILKKNGSLWVIGSFQNIHRLGYILQDMGAWIINEIVWEKSNPVPNFGGTRFVNSQETMLWVTKSKKSKFTFNYKTMKKVNGGKQMKSVWTFPISSGKERLKDENGIKVHSTQKPLKLLERIILATSKPGDVVLDPFSGSGTTAHAAKMSQRNYIGIELDAKYVKYSRQRLESVELSNDLDLINAVYDIKPPTVKYKDLLNSNYILITDKFKLKDYVFNFNEDGLIKYENEFLTPNKLGRLLYGVPTNTWDHIIHIETNQVISKIRDTYREEVLKWKKMQ